MSEGKVADSKQRWYRRHSLSLVVVATTVVLFLGYVVSQWPDYQQTQQHMHESAAFWSLAYLNYCVAQWLINASAEGWGAVLILLFSKWFLEAGSTESK